MGGQDDLQGMAMLSFAAENQGWQKVMIIRSDGACCIRVIVEVSIVVRRSARRAVGLVLYMWLLLDS